jgi:hypothetical protein
MAQQKIVLFIYVRVCHESHGLMGFCCMIDAMGTKFYMADFCLKGAKCCLVSLILHGGLQYSCAPISAGNMFRDLLRLRETMVNTERNI